MKISAVKHYAPYVALVALPVVLDVPYVARVFLLLDPPDVALVVVLRYYWTHLFTIFILLVLVDVPSSWFALVVLASRRT